MHFQNDAEYYETLGYLSREERDVVIYTHDNYKSGAWAGQGKLETRVHKCDLPDGLYAAFIQSGDNRLSVTEYVRNLVNNHAFTRFIDPTGEEYTFHIYPDSLERVKSTVPRKFWKDFEKGYYW